MLTGVLIFPTDQTIPPVEMAKLVEDRGFGSLWFPEHTHIPASRATPYPAGGDLPEMYWRTLDQFTALSAAAAVTTDLKLGSGICLVNQHNPIALAKTVATVDRISDGRLLFGVGAGWNREEMANHGVDARTRMRRMAEHIDAMKAVWTQDEAEFHGEFVDFDPVWSWPKPTQQPHPPVYVGGNGPTVLDRVLAFGDVWLPNVIHAETLIAQMDELQQRAQDAGRDRIPVVLYAAPAKAERLAPYLEYGVDGLIFNVMPGTREEISDRLDYLRGVLEGVGVPG